MASSQTSNNNTTTTTTTTTNNNNHTTNNTVANNTSDNNTASWVDAWAAAYGTRSFLPSELEYYDPLADYDFDGNDVEGLELQVVVELIEEYVDAEYVEDGFEESGIRHIEGLGGIEVSWISGIGRDEDLVPNRSDGIGLSHQQRISVVPEEDGQ
ncbi:uncharacterized protein Z519_05903 [Cladophialophora bantiana CBS 173.52]|uniref:Uncharacterized protein n=1 Tax=Cladophialophora bantiana (strain ATCC 10958 / CBS 173.52 / CDC B-1940 / NIH 8579) TaxID=1442370 RepID=A0A0D2HJ20_CLAB1|nr:uncharacterized protein Z519_05903 [Cladophialophora bantiana CBS 173.52]KIW93298.1 hypothetical protein Z519_05903 [Cladophialophora bantiana CBS 173.52]